MKNPELTGEQYEALLRYLEDRRGKYMAVLVTDVLGMVLTALPAAMVLWRLLDENAGFGIPKKLFHAAVAFVLLSILLIMLLAHGWQVYYGRRSPYACVKRLAFTVSAVTVRKLLPDTGKHPYKINCTDGMTYICPVYLDYKDAKVCAQMLGICMDYGARYIMQPADTEKTLCEKMK